ncbi:MAG: hypothetical protein K6U80_05035 [Firmicutes bacterium]|nr:hypothetical protein [Bacillota bacterium]
MFSPDDLEKIRQAMIPLGAKNAPDCDKKKSKKNKDRDRDNNKSPGDNGANICDFINLTPAQILIIAGFLAGVLEVTSVLVDKDQAVQIVLSGSLKRPTQLDQVMEQIVKMPFDQVMRSIMENSQ